MLTANWLKCEVDDMLKNVEASWLLLNGWRLAMNAANRTWNDVGLARVACDFPAEFARIACEHEMLMYDYS